MENLIVERRRYVVLVDKETRKTVVSCSMCEKTRKRDQGVIKFDFELARAAAGWASHCFNAKSLIPNADYPHCAHILFDTYWEKLFPVVRGWIDSDSNYLPVLKQ